VWDQQRMWPLKLLGYGVAVLAGAALVWGAVALRWLG
jgi:hypothetical protein